MGTNSYPRKLKKLLSDEHGKVKGVEEDIQSWKASKEINKDMNAKKVEFV